MKETYLLLIQRVDGEKERRCRKKRKEMLCCSSFVKWLSTRAQHKQHERGEEKRDEEKSQSSKKFLFSWFSSSILRLHSITQIILAAFTHRLSSASTESCDMFAPRASVEMVTKWRKNDCDYELSSSWDSISLFERLTPALTAAYNTTHDRTASAAVEWERGGWGDCKKSRYSSLTVKLTGIYNIYIFYDSRQTITCNRNKNSEVKKILRVQGTEEREEKGRNNKFYVITKQDFVIFSIHPRTYALLLFRILCEGMKNAKLLLIHSRRWQTLHESDDKTIYSIKKFNLRKFIKMMGCGDDGDDDDGAVRADLKSA